MDAEQRKLRAQLGAEISWARTADRTARTSAGLRAAEARFETQAREMHPDGSPQLIAKVAEHLRKAHMRAIALKSVETRNRKRQSTEAA